MAGISKEGSVSVVKRLHPTIFAKADGKELVIIVHIVWTHWAHVVAELIFCLF